MYWWWVFPVLLTLCIKFCIRQMARDTSHKHITMTPCAAKIKIKGVILDVLVGRVCLGLISGSASAANHSNTHGRVRSTR